MSIISTETFIEVPFTKNTQTIKDLNSSHPSANRCLVAGWGETGFMINDAPTTPQKQVTVPIVSLTECRQSLSATAVLGANVDRYLDQTGGEICAGGRSMRDACTVRKKTPKTRKF